MNLLLKIINNPKEAISEQSHEFKKESGTIGRESDCSWVLLDKQGAVSRIHLEVEYKQGSYFMIDVSTNGTLYTRENRKVPPKEIVPFVEGEVLSIGPYDILVGFVKSENKSDVIGELLNKREIDIALQEKLLMRREGNSPLDIILKEKVEDKDILEFANIQPQEVFSLEDAFDDVASTNVYSTHITPPTLVKALSQQQGEVAEGSDRLMQLFSAKLGIQLEGMNPTKQTELISDLADALLVSLVGVEQLKKNREYVSKKLEKPTLKVELKKSKKAKLLLQELLHKRSHTTAAQQLSSEFEAVTQHHIALYESTKVESESLAHEFSPNTLEEEFKITNPLLRLFGKEAKMWRAYSRKYQHLNEITGAKGLQGRLFTTYQNIMEIFNVTKGSK